MGTALSRLNPILALVLALAAQVSSAVAANFTAPAQIGPAILDYEGQDIVVDGCTVTIDGPHAFKSLTIQNHGVVTSSPAPAGEAQNRLYRAS